ncbi:MAG: aminopeptidase N [Rhodospirillales bacterium]|nr:aminopeptidase N [Rhodospirillales bacterium]
MTAEPKAIKREDYRQLGYHIKTTELFFELEENSTKVTNRLTVLRQDSESKTDFPFVLNGEDLTLLSLKLDDIPLEKGSYDLSSTQLILSSLPNEFVLEVETKINPAENTKLEGLYLSSGNYCTQCEAEGFRRITFFPDRPDVLATYTVTIQADKTKFPVLLSNGNLVEEGSLENGRHFAKWHDPFPKPSYLFALVAGNLAKIEDNFTTGSGRDVALRIFVEPGNEDRCAYAMDSLKRAMKWDEEVYGLEYDLDLFNIVAVGDFNMGAMENKSLNVFNSKYVLANSETATDADYGNIEAIVAHEYFHNWTGNRVTCRDWFQLSLKEGLTVFRDQEFSGDMRSRPVQRIGDVRMLRGRQFMEDAGPLAHPVRPDSYIEINNFYTATVYEKGAEVIRMMHRLLGAENYRKGMDLYFERHDGQAVTCDDFVLAMEAASGVDLERFRRWYSQAGTPTVEALGDYDEEAKKFTLTLKQSTPPTPGQSKKEPLHMPFDMALIGQDGQEITYPETQSPLDFRQTEQQFVFNDITVRPVLSLNRGFAAPVYLKTNQTDDELAFLMAKDNDPFARWEAGQQYATKILLAMTADQNLVPDRSFIEAIGGNLADPTLDKAFAALAVSLPDEDFLAEQMDVVDIDGIHQARKTLKKAIAQSFEDKFYQVYRANLSNQAYEPTAEQAGQRSLKNAALSYIAALETEQSIALVADQYQSADNMTDTMAALICLNDLEASERQTALDHFYNRFKDDVNVVDKWLALQAKSTVSGTLQRVTALLTHEAFTIKNPNKVRSLIGVFAIANPVVFHANDGTGYDFLADRVIELNEVNPQVAARLIQPLGRWRKFAPQRQELMKAALERVLNTPNLAKDIYEITSKSLG